MHSQIALMFTFFSFDAQFAATVLKSVVSSASMHSMKGKKTSCAGFNLIAHV